MKTEDEKKWDKLCKEIEKRENFLDKVDNRDTDPDYSLEEQRAEDEKYERYEKELINLREELEKLRKKLPSFFEVIT